jgi:predicted TIM-barrel fold metal-dependent hydrolase
MCGADPTRLFRGAAISPHDVTSAVAETRCAASELRMKTLFLHPNIFTNRPWHRAYYDHLGAVCQELSVPVGFHQK